MDTPQLVNIDQKRGKYLYRYLKKEHLIDFLSTKKLFISRSDNFLDKFECVTEDQITKIFQLEPVTREDFNFNPNIQKNDLIKSIEIARKSYEVEKSVIKKAQKETFINCWYNADNETMALWDMYSDPQNTFALRVEKDVLIDHLCTLPEITKNKNPSFLGNVEYIS